MPHGLFILETEPSGESVGDDTSTTEASALRIANAGDIHAASTTKAFEGLPPISAWIASRLIDDSLVPDPVFH